MEGYPGFLSILDSGPSGNTLCDISNVLYITSNNLVTGFNWGKSGAVMAYISGVATNNALHSPSPIPKYLIVEGGVNNIHSSQTFATEQTYFDSIKSLCATKGATMLVEEVWPANSTYATDANIVAWNTALNTWASSNSITVIAMHNWMGDAAASPPYSAMVSTYTVDGTHPSQTGVQRHADKLYSTLQILEP